MNFEHVKFGHMTDIHLPIPEKPSFGALLNKRVLGYLSWLRRRSELHKQDASDHLAADLSAQSCNAALISGDIVNIALPEEFKQARHWLEDRFSSLPVIFTPGNHDAYIKTEWKECLGLLSPYMTGKRSWGEKEREPDGPDDFPFVRTHGRVAFIMANSSPPTAPGLASGRIGVEQINRLQSMLEEAHERQLFRVLVLHHPVNDGIVSSRKALDDRQSLRDMIAETGVELVLHGHMHRPIFETITTPAGTAPVIGGGSASHPFGHGKYHPARYNLFSLDKRDNGQWRLILEVRELDPEADIVKTVETRVYDYPVSA